MSTTTPTTTFELLNLVRDPTIYCRDAHLDWIQPDFDERCVTFHALCTDASGRGEDGAWQTDIAHLGIICPIHSVSGSDFDLVVATMRRWLRQRTPLDMFYWAGEHLGERFSWSGGNISALVINHATGEIVGAGKAAPVNGFHALRPTEGG